ncbi:MAG: isoaspartyl peptidase/L-asparaginase [Bacteroidales bacterium]|jgi:beta-aspartyl-peptidase (threonine type)|nr:isoaspartyl peptidase/L-asparaginase [Bacteroidales bacterium]MDD4673551.1 isoaspartyl peptidase/L-asparaginase [Bacteroidales bacterium]MDY0349244.1 isoaspartyl peptidase/L-asparaginase [Tenuifilaceae bacterium]
MKSKTFLLPFLLVFVLLSSCQTGSNKKVNDWAIALHGGAGAMIPANYTDEQVQKYEAELKNALAIGEDILKNGGSSLDAVEKVVNYLEDCPLFNAGRGAVFTNDGKNELDAAIMFGKDLTAGAVAGVGDIKNPISAARMVMENSPHVLMVGKGASLFASQNGAEIVDSSYFYTEESYRTLQRALERDRKMGTVGCVALDTEGNLSAATSTGGMTNKRYGRVGDVPIIGAGTYANNSTCAISATGHGEYFIRYTVAHDISALMEYKGFSLDKAADDVVQRKLVDVGGEGGIIAVDKWGNVHLSFNSLGMFRAFATSSGEGCVAIFQ